MQAHSKNLRCTRAALPLKTHNAAQESRGLDSDHRVSVVIPLYNHASYISDAIGSVLAQGSLVREIIVIDDGSTDDSADVMETLSRVDKRVTFIRQENSGAHSTINRGVLLCTGEFVSILNSDDAYEPGRFAALVRALDIDPGSDFAASSIAFMDGDGAAIENPWFVEALGNFKARRDLPTSLIDSNFLMTTSNFIMRRTVFDRVGLFAPLRYAHDLDFALRLCVAGIRLAFIDRPLLKYRFHSSNTISESHDKVRLEWALCAAMFKRMREMRDGRTAYFNQDELEKVLEKHNLTRAVDVCLRYLNKMGVNELTNDFISNINFREDVLRAA